MGRIGFRRSEIGTSRWRLETGNKFWLFDFTKPRTFTPAASGTLVVRWPLFGGPGLHAWLEEELGAGRTRSSRYHRNPPRPCAQDIPSCGGWSRARGWLGMGRTPPHHANAARVLRQPRAVGYQRRRPARAHHPPCRRLAAEPFRDWQAYELASVAGLSYWPFRRLFRRHLAQDGTRPPATPPRRRREDPARRSVAADQGDRAAMHFASGRYFSYFFRSQTGMSPTEFRDRVMERRA